MSGFDGAPVGWKLWIAQLLNSPKWKHDHAALADATLVLPSAEGGVFYTDQQFHPIGAEDGVSLTNAQALQQFVEFIESYRESGGRQLYL